MTLVAVHGVDAEHLSLVEADMGRLGRPTIRAIEIAGVLFALEGTHRLAAAAMLGIVPLVDVVVDGDAPDDALVTNLDLDERATWTVGDLRAYLDEGIITHDRAIYTKYDVI